MSRLARFIAMAASPLSLMLLSIPLSSIYSKYVLFREAYRIQSTMKENIRYVIYDNTKSIERNNKWQKRKKLDVTQQIHEYLKKLSLS